MSRNYNDYFAGYLAYVEGLVVVDALKTNHREFMELLGKINEEKSQYRYADGKWSIRQLVSHVIDSERVFAYRAMRFARKDTTELAGFDENHYAAHSGAEERPLADLAHEFDVTRQSSVALFNSFTPAMLEGSGLANGITMDVRMLGLLIAGHCRHHAKILRERYLK